MKTKSIFLGLAMLSLITWSCTTEGDLASNGSLKSSMNSSAQSLQTAMNNITSTTAYQLLSTKNPTNSGMMMSKQAVAGFDTTYNQILLADVAGVWDYKPSYYKRWNPDLLRFFQKSTTESSSDMMVRLPESKVKKPWTLQSYNPVDTVNNYVLDVSKYAYHFNRYLGWDYDMATNISISGTSVGDLAIQSSNSRAKGYHFASSFVFANGYNAGASYTSGDTIISVYNISKAGQILYQEKYTAIRTSSMSRHREKEYSLTIGNVEIVRKAGPTSLDSAKVYVGGVLQLHSKVQFIDVVSTSTAADSTETTITNHHRELQITFDDGSSTTIKTLLGNTIDDIRTLFASIRQTYFAVGVVDWVAWDIYINKL